jgi:hypothetical protein
MKWLFIFVATVSHVQASAAFGSFNSAQNRSANTQWSYEIQKTQGGETLGDPDGVYAWSIPVPKRILKVSNADVTAARGVLSTALEQSAQYNKARLANPRRTRYHGRGDRPSHGNESITVPVFKVTRDIAEAAALIAEFEAASEIQNRLSLVENGNDANTQLRGPLTNSTQSAGASFWMENLRHMGTQPFGNDPKYVVSITVHIVEA